MTYIVQTEVKGHPYYYLVRNERTSFGWKKHKLYLGKEVPGKKQLASLGNKLLKKTGTRRIVHLKPAFLTPEEKKRLASARHLSFEEEKRFLIQFSVHSNGIEGSKLDNADTVKIIFDKRTPKNAALRDVYEAVNTEEAYTFIKNYEKDLSKRFLLQLHSILMWNLIEDKGEFRTKNVKVTGAGFHPPPAEQLDQEIERLLSFYRFLKRKYTPVETAALMHVKFIELHPFSDGNGRCGRLLLNFILMKNDLPPIVIKKDERKEYYSLLDKAITEKDYASFVRFVWKKVVREPAAC
jgi:Fic family protein